MEMKDDQIVIYDEEGNKYLMEILFTYENEERGTKYAFIFDKDSPDDILVMKYTEDGNEMEVVEDEEELNEAEEVLEAYQNDPAINELKDM